MTINRLISEDVLYLPINFVMEQHVFHYKIVESAFIRSLKTTSDKLYYRNKNHVPIIRCTAEKHRLLSEVYKTTSDKLYYRNKNHVPIIGCTAEKHRLLSEV